MNIIKSTFGFPFVLDTCKQGKIPRKYKRPLGTRQYANYSEENLERCLEDIRTGVMSQRVAAAHYQIPRSTVKNKFKGDFNRKPGRPTMLSLPGLVVKLPSGGKRGPTVKCMMSLKKCWKWPAKNDILVYNWYDVKQKINPPKLLSRRGCFSVPELSGSVHF
jgi:hypothetical protein